MSYCFSLVSNIMRDMTDQERQDLQLKQFYKQSDDLQHLLEDASAQRDWERERPIIMHIDKLPKHDLGMLYVILVVTGVNEKIISKIYVLTT